MKLTMLVCCHKEDIMATAEPYMPLQVGKDISKIDLNIQGDNTGDNISCKNQSYCELTGMYCPLLLLAGGNGVTERVRGRLFGGTGADQDHLVDTSITRTET